MNLKYLFEPLEVRVTSAYPECPNAVKMVRWKMSFTDQDSGMNSISMGMTALDTSSGNLINAEEAAWGDLERAVVAHEGGPNFIASLRVQHENSIRSRLLEKELVPFDNITPPINNLSEVKDRLRREIDAVRDAKIAEGVEYQGIVYDSDSTSTQRIMGTVQLMREGGMESREWIAKDNTKHILAVEDFVQIGSLISAWEERCVFVSRQGKDAVIAATSFSEAETAKRNCVDMLQALTQS